MSRVLDEIVRGKACIVGISLLTVWVFVASNLIWPSIIELGVDPSQVGSDGGQAYTARLDRAFPFTSYGDGAAGERSTAQLFENGRSLGPAHTSHQIIREVGKGAFSHWDNMLWFSSSDGTDPRTNGYRYSVSAKRELRLDVIWLAAAITIVGVLFLLPFRRLTRHATQAARVVMDNPYQAAASSAAILQKHFARSNWSGVVWIAIAALWCALIGLWLLFPTSLIELTPSTLQSDTGYAYAYTARISAPFPYALPGDDAVAGNRSTLQIVENGIPIGPPHTSHQTIRDSGKGAFAHYADTLLFSSSDGTDPRTNGYKYIATAKRQIRGEVICALLVLTGVALMLTRGFSPVTRSIHALIPLAYGSLRLIGAAGCLLGVVLLGSSLFGWYNGDQLPLARLFKVLPDADKALRIFPYACLVIAIFGATVSWLASLDLLNRAAVRRREITALRDARAYGLIVALAILVSMLGSGGWSGDIGPGDLHKYSLAGLIPHSDAGAYYRGSFDMGFGGEWNWVASSRPLAAAFRDFVTYIGRYSFPTTLVVQAILLSIACYAAALSIAYWLGIWSALAFFALALIMIKPFLPTTGSESLCLIWAFLSVACLAHACRTGAVQSAAFALGFFSMAQFTRMGAVLALGAVSLWILALPKYSAAHIARRIVLVVIAIGIPAALGSILKNAYEFQSNIPTLGGVSFGGWNLGAIACEFGASAGFTECRNLHALQLQGRSPPEISDVYSHVWGLIAANPLVVLQPMANNIHSFLAILPRALVFGYTGYTSSTSISPMILAVAAFPGLIFYFVKRARRPELVLWPSLWLAILGSIAVVFLMDGWRALYATHPLMAAFVAIAFTTPSVLRPSHVPMSFGKPLSLAGLAIILLLVTPWAVHRELSPGEAVVYRQNPSAATVLGGSMITGFLVLPDGQAPDQKFASLSHSDFQAVLKSARLDERWRASISLFPAPPFAVIWAPRIAKDQPVEVFISPTHVLEDREAARWHFEVTPEVTNTPILMIVRSAKPISDGR